MPLPDNEPEMEKDWEITPDGLYVATRHFLLRRGYCCANRCRNCPYINWRSSPTWQHAPASVIRRTRVSPKTLAGAQTALAHHEQALANAPEGERAYHQDMIEHYRCILEHWW